MLSAGFEINFVKLSEIVKSDGIASDYTPQSRGPKSYI